MLIISISHTAWDNYKKWKRKILEENTKNLLKSQVTTRTEVKISAWQHQQFVQICAKHFSFPVFYLVIFVTPKLTGTSDC